MWVTLQSPNTSQELSPNTGTEDFHFQYPFLSAKSRAVKSTTLGALGYSGLIQEKKYLFSEFLQDGSLTWVIKEREEGNLFAWWKL